MIFDRRAPPRGGGQRGGAVNLEQCGGLPHAVRTVGMIVWPGMKESAVWGDFAGIADGSSPQRSGARRRRAQGMEPLDQTVCRLIERAAGANRLPVEFLTRLIWRESSFRPGAVSPAGARGIAQFMPGTAQERGLADPFDPEQAIPKAAHLLADLRRRFGNLGVAAAAYNAGPARVSDWLQRPGGLPAETRAYVRFVTRSAVEAWTGSDSSAEDGASGGERGKAKDAGRRAILPRGGRRSAPGSGGEGE